MNLRMLFRALLLLCVSGLLPSAPARAGEPKSLAAANEGVLAGRALRSWLVLGPVGVGTNGEPSAAVQKQAFTNDLLSAGGGEKTVIPDLDRSYQVGDAELQWKRIDVLRDVVSLGTFVGRTNHAIAYAWTEVVVPSRTNVVLGIGSDDAIKVWLNGALVHEKWLERRVQRNEDLIPVRLVAGTNQILFKVQNWKSDWGFAANVVTREELVEAAVRAAGQGDMERLTEVLALRVDVNAPNRAGLSAYQAAQISGFKDVAKFLSTRGADTDQTLPLAGRLIDGLFADIVKGDSPGAAVLVAQDGRVLFAEGYGYASIEHHAPITPQTRFRIGSISKQFTAAAILLLQEAGKLNVTNKLSRFFSDYPRGDEVTLHYLLTHTSGIHSYTERPDFFASVTAEVKPADLIALFKDDPFDFSPGEKWHYSNSGYFLLGEIVAKVSGKSYGDFLRERIFDVAGMTNSGVHRAQDIIEQEATGYGFNEGAFKKALNWDMSRAGGAGALYSTVEDLYRWNEALFAGKILSPASLKAAFKPVKLKNSEDSSAPASPVYGYGWITGEFRGLKEIQHSGGLHGFSSHLVRYPEENLTVVVLANASPAPPGLEPTRVCQEIAQIYLWEKMSARASRTPNATVDPRTYQRYVGRYDYGSGAILTVSVEQNRLFAQLSGQTRYEIFPRSDQEFFWKMVEASVKFVTNADGKVVKAVHQQNGQTFEAPRLE